MKILRRYNNKTYNLLLSQFTDGTVLVDIIIVDVEVVDVEVEVGVLLGDVLVVGVVVGDLFVISAGEFVDVLVKCKDTPVAIPPVTNTKTKPSTNHFFFEIV